MKDKILRFEITDRCNMRCDMCWSKEWTHNDLSGKKVEKILYDFRKIFIILTIIQVHHIHYRDHDLNQNYE